MPPMVVVVILLILASLPLLVGSSWIFLRDMDDEDNNENPQPDYTTGTPITEGRIPRITNSPSGVSSFLFSFLKDII